MDDINRGQLMYPLFSRLVSAFRSFFGLSEKSPGKVARVHQEPALPNWKTETVHAEPFEKVGRIAMCCEGLEIHSDLDSRAFILLNEDIDAGPTGINGISGYSMPGAWPGQPGYLHRAGR